MTIYRVYATDYYGQKTWEAETFDTLEQAEEYKAQLLRHYQYVEIEEDTL